MVKLMIMVSVGFSMVYLVIRIRIILVKILSELMILVIRCLLFVIRVGDWFVCL